MSNVLTFIRRAPVCVILWPLLYVCTFLVLLGFGKENAHHFWRSIT